MSESFEFGFIYLNGRLVVPIDEPSVHNANGFCDDPSCPCHQDPELIQTFNQQYQDGEVAIDAVRRIYNGGW